MERTPRTSPIKKNHVNSTKRELEMYGNRPISPTRDRPGRVTQYQLYSRLSRDGSFGDEYNKRVFSPWARSGNSSSKVNRRMERTAGPGNKAPGVTVNSSRIDAILQDSY
jgi:hypothetical protein